MLAVGWRRQVGRVYMSSDWVKLHLQGCERGEVSSVVYRMGMVNHRAVCLDPLQAESRLSPHATSLGGFSAGVAEHHIVCPRVTGVSLLSVGYHSPSSTSFVQARRLGHQPSPHPRRICFSPTTAVCPLAVEPSTNPSHIHSLITHTM